MLYMVIETFRNGQTPQVYQRYREKGRMLPDGLEYVSSWVEQDGDRCFQLMRTANPQLFDLWISHWGDIVEFEIVAVSPSPTAKVKSI